MNCKEKKWAYRSLNQEVTSRMAKDLLLEIGMEEIPARFMAPAITQIRDMANSLLTANRIPFETIKVLGTPRRLALLITAVSEEQALLEEEVKGPSEKAAYDSDGNPTKALLGFAKSQSVDVQDIIKKETENGVYVYAIKKFGSSLSITVLPGLLLHIIQNITFPKPMRWAYGEFKFARPIRWVIALFGAEILPLQIEDVKADRYTYGHRFLSQGKLEIAVPSEYIEKLRENYVIVDQQERHDKIWQAVQALAKAEGGEVYPDAELLEEITFILEYATPLCGKFDESYLELPSEALITPMREHQRYFPVYDAEGKLINKFIAVRNGTAQHLDIVTAGNEKVLRARLADAKFFYQEDLKTPLEEKLPKLKNIVFHELLGSLDSKVERIGKLAVIIADKLDYSPDTLKSVKRAALLCKADLVTNMVYEFTELQGIMGKYYATANGEDADVAGSIEEHYLPRFAGDILPTIPAAIALSIADKLDNLVGFFAAGIKPSGSQDPYALRRQALAISNIIINRNLKLNLWDMVKAAYQLYVGQNIALKVSENDSLNDIKDFMRQRLMGIFGEKELGYDVIDAVLSADFANISDTAEKALILANFRENAAFEALITGYTRASNLAKKAESKKINPEYFVDEAEKELFNVFARIQKQIEPALKVSNFEQVFRLIATLRTPIDNFFTTVMVMVEDEKVRNNRLALLAQISDYINNIADLSKIVV